MRYVFIDDYANTQTYTIRCAIQNLCALKATQSEGELYYHSLLVSADILQPA